MTETLRTEAIVSYRFGIAEMLEDPKLSWGAKGVILLACSTKEAIYRKDFYKFSGDIPELADAYLDEALQSKYIKAVPD